MVFKENKQRKQLGQCLHHLGTPGVSILSALGVYGFISITGVPSLASIQATWITPFSWSIRIIGTAVKAIGFGRIGDLVANIPITAGAFLYGCGASRTFLASSLSKPLNHQITLRWLNPSNACKAGIYFGSSSINIPSSLTLILPIGVTLKFCIVHSFT